MKVELESVESLYPCVLTEEQEHLRREIREFAAREIAPNMMAWDEANEFPLATIKKLGAMGLMGMIFPPEYGGAGLGYVDYTLAIEELSAVDGSVGLTVAAHNSLGSNHIFLAGNERQAQICSAACERGMAGGVGADRAGLWIGRGRREDNGCEEGRQLCVEWEQDIHHEWELCRCCRGYRDH